VYFLLFLLIFSPILFIGIVGYYTIFFIFIEVISQIKKKFQGGSFNYLCVFIIQVIILSYSSCCYYDYNYLEINNYDPPYDIVVLNIIFFIIFYWVVFYVYKPSINWFKLKNPFILSIPPGVRIFFWSLFWGGLFYMDGMAISDLFDIVNMPVIQTSIPQKIISVSFMLLIFVYFGLYVLAALFVFVWLFTLQEYFNCRNYVNVFKSIKIFDLNILGVDLILQFVMWLLAVGMIYISISSFINYFHYYGDRNIFKPVIFEFYYHDIPGFCNSKEAQDYRNSEGKMIFLSVEGKSSFTRLNKEKKDYEFIVGECKD
jgi:membrane protein